jgi:hypothetical protein
MSWPIPMLTLLLAGAMVQASAHAQCPAPDQTRNDLLNLRLGGFAIEDDALRDQVAIGLLACTGDPDPAIRDGVVYEGLAAWLRGRQLSGDAVMTLRSALVDQLQTADDPEGFRKPFAALVLSEVARSDRVEPLFTSGQREELVTAAAVYLRGVSDYRGFSESEGWRHGVAHGADLVLQLVLNPNIDAAQTLRLLEAVATQVAPPGEVFYIYGEPNRLSRAVFHAQRRGDLSPADWAEWLMGIVDPGPLGSWNDAWATQAGLARRHNTLAFLQALYLSASSAGDPQSHALATQVMEALARVSG